MSKRPWIQLSSVLVTALVLIALFQNCSPAFTSKNFDNLSLGATNGVASLSLKANERIAGVDYPVSSTDSLATGESYELLASANTPFARLTWSTSSVPSGLCSTSSPHSSATSATTTLACTGSGLVTVTATAESAAGEVIGTLSYAAKVESIREMAPQGRSLYESNCASCHGDLAATTKSGRSLSLLATAIQNEAAMSYLKKLSAANLHAIVAALESPSATPTPIASTPTPTPTPVSSSGTMSVPISAGATHTCAVKNAKAYCWGQNNYGQLGNGTTIDSNIPVEVKNLSGVAAVMGGENFSCAVTSEGKAYCWGNNADAALGNDQRGGISNVPVAVALDKKVKLLSSNGLNACALTQTNEVYCWGWSALGELGDASEGNPSNRPVLVTLPGVSGTLTSLASSWHHHCAMNDAGKEWCWGDQRNGRLGDGVNDSSHIRAAPKEILVSGNVKAIGNYGAGGCSVLKDGSAKCWGTNENSQLGQGASSGEVAQPTLVKNLSGALAIDGGGFFVCALTDLGKVKCWGNMAGASPTEIAGTPGAIVALSAGGNHACVMNSSAQAYCWGENGNGQLGNATTTKSTGASRVTGF
jgi:alpha-tubulin suppressor-like RCC1 family protein